MRKNQILSYPLQRKKGLDGIGQEQVWEEN